MASIRSINLVETNPNTWLNFTYTPGYTARHCKTAGCNRTITKEKSNYCADCLRRNNTETVRQRKKAAIKRNALK